MQLKTFSALFILMMFAGKITFAQATPQPDTTRHIIRICAPSRADMLARPPLYVLLGNNKVVMTTKTDSMSAVNPKDIKSINVLKGAEATQKYGQKALYGVIEIYLKDERYPKDYLKGLQKDTVGSKN